MDFIKVPISARLKTEIRRWQDVEIIKGMYVVERLRNETVD